METSRKIARWNIHYGRNYAHVQLLIASQVAVWVKIQLKVEGNIHSLTVFEKE